jgi:biopolymer transport protein TolQ
METLFRIAEASAQGILYFMAIMSVVSFSIMIERYFAIKKMSASGSKVANGLRIAIEAQDLGQINHLSEGNSSMEAKALSHGLCFVKKHGISGLDELFNSFKAIEKPTLEKNLNILGTIASNAPYVGLLGTVMGIMKAFNDLANSPGQGNEVVMAGIAHALVSTAIGLAVAIPAVVAFNHFQKQIGLVLTNIDAARDLCLAYTKSRKE